MKHGTHGLGHMLLCCVAMVAPILVIGRFASDWSAVVLPVALLLCPLVMLILMGLGHATEPKGYSDETPH